MYSLDDVINFLDVKKPIPQGFNLRASPKKSLDPLRGTTERSFNRQNSYFITELTKRMIDDLLRLHGRKRRNAPDIFDSLWHLHIKEICEKTNGDYDETDTFFEEWYSILRKKFKRVQTIYADTLSTHNIQCHLYAIDDVIYEIVCTEKLDLKTKQFFTLKLLATYAIGQIENKSISSIGLLLPIQQEICIINLSKWNWRPFWSSVLHSLEHQISITPTESDLNLYTSVIQPRVGGHVRKGDAISSTLDKLLPSFPYQFFLAGRTVSKVYIDVSEQKKVKKLSKTYHLYIHSPYTLNLSRDYENDNKTNLEGEVCGNWMIRSLQDHLILGRNMGFRGVVVHCGTKVEMDQQVAYDNMMNAVVVGSKYATENCPLLIETSAGEKGELLSKPNELVTFYSQLSKEVQKVVKICVDTCHVFSAGTMPMEFIQILTCNNVPIHLIHYNDSEGGIGCCRDRHASIGDGKISLRELNKVGLWAIENGVDLVRE